MTREEYVHMLREKLACLDGLAEAARRYFRVEIEHSLEAAVRQLQEEKADEGPRRAFLIEQLAVKTAYVQALESQLENLRKGLEAAGKIEGSQFEPLVYGLLGILEPTVDAARREVSTIQQNLEEMEN